MPMKWMHSKRNCTGKGSARMIPITKAYRKIIRCKDMGMVELEAELTLGENKEERLKALFDFADQDVRDAVSSMPPDLSLWDKPTLLENATALPYMCKAQLGSLSATQVAWLTVPTVDILLAYLKIDVGTSKLLKSEKVQKLLAHLNPPTTVDQEEQELEQALEQEMEVEHEKEVDVEMELEQELQHEQETVLDSTAAAAVVQEQRVFLLGASYTKGDLKALNVDKLKVMCAQAGLLSLSGNRKQMLMDRLWDKLSGETIIGDSQTTTVAPDAVVTPPTIATAIVSPPAAHTTTHPPPALPTVPPQQAPPLWTPPHEAESNTPEPRTTIVAPPDAVVTTPTTASTIVSPPVSLPFPPPPPTAVPSIVATEAIMEVSTQPPVVVQQGMYKRPREADVADL
mmetsp:Transcript_27941/g.46845  ORF Transcript_27941/g.46845 Transcript_27941/m.46845 type:complete len:399 (-) Transcript_27941:257-1453(-)